MLLAGVWFGENKPVMSTFLQPIVEELLKLERDGKFILILYLIDTII